MKERPILFSGPMVRALLAGAKTQTRRVVKPSAQFRAWDSEPRHAYDAIVADDMFAAAFLVAGDHGFTDWVPCPHGKPGDRLWIRETWQKFAYGYDPIPLNRFGGNFAPFVGVCNGVPLRWRACYAADGPLEHPIDGPARWRPSIHMPRWASRITLEVTGVRVERLQNISEDDAKAEGLKVTGPTVNSAGEVIDDRPGYLGYGSLWHDPRRAFETIWDSINGKRAPWASNPWVWALEFKVANVAGGSKEAA